MANPIKALKNEMSVIEQEITFWFNRVLALENEHKKLEADIYGNHNERLEELEDELAAILKRVKKEGALLEKFRKKYNKEAKKRRMQLIS